MFMDAESRGKMARNYVGLTIELLTIGG